MRLSAAGWARGTWAGLTGGDPYGSRPLDAVAEANAAAGQTGLAGLVGAALCLLVGSGAALPAWLVGLVWPACGGVLGAGVGLWAAAPRSGSGGAGVRRGSAAAGSPAPPP